MFNIILFWIFSPALSVVILGDSRTKNGCEEGEILLDSEILVEREAPRHIADVLSDFLIIFYNIPALYGSRALIRQEEGGEHTKDGGFARPIGTYKPKKLAFFYL